MSNQRIKMQKLKKLIEFTIANTAQRTISSVLGIHRRTVVNYQGLLKSHTGGDLNLLADSTEEDLWQIVTLKDNPTAEKDLFLLFPEYENQLSKVGVTIRFLWEGHCKAGSNLISYSQFCRLFRKWGATQKLTLRMEHKAGDKLFIDFAGNKLHLTDAQTGLKTPVEVFLAVLGYSQLTYCQAVYSQKKADFILALANSLTFFGGVPQAIVPDNLKSAVKKASKYEPDINDSLADFAAHYNTTIYPTRSHSPKDKALVEKTVSIIYTRVYAVLSKQVFYSLNALNEAIRELITLHNQALFQGKSDSRQLRYDQIERQALQPLPATRYELKLSRIAKVHPDCHVKLSDDKHYYSVPYKYVGQHVKIRYSAETVEVYHNYSRIAIHKRLHKIGAYSTNKDHLHPSHQWVLNWSPEFFLKQAQNIGNNTLKAIEQVLNAKRYPEQAYKTCAGILALTKKENIGKKRLEDACERALAYDYVSLKVVNGILDNGLDSIAIYEEKQTRVIPLHSNIRGSDQYK
jgi:transposase